MLNTIAIFFSKKNLLENKFNTLLYVLQKSCLDVCQFDICAFEKVTYKLAIDISIGFFLKQLRSCCLIYCATSDAQYRLCDVNEKGGKEQSERGESGEKKKREKEDVCIFMCGKQRERGCVCVKRGERERRGRKTEKGRKREAR